MCFFHLSYLCVAGIHKILNSFIQQSQDSWLNFTVHATILTSPGLGIQQLQPRESYDNKFIRADVAPCFARLHVVFGMLELNSYST